MAIQYKYRLALECNLTEWLQKKCHVNYYCFLYFHNTEMITFN